MKINMTKKEAVMTFGDLESGDVFETIANRGTVYLKCMKEFNDLDNDYAIRLADGIITTEWDPCTEVVYRDDAKLIFE